jgi:hypothetical protein
MHGTVHTTEDYDDNGWARGAVAPLASSSAWTLLSPEPEARVDAARWSHQAATFFRAELGVEPPKRYPSGAVPLADRILVDLTVRGATDATRVLVVTLPIDRLPEALTLGIEGARAIGGAGFDAILPRTRRVWQVCATVPAGSEARAPLALAAILASLFLAPIVPPGGGTIFGVKGGRERLAAQGLHT